jgi:two-component sensor histidine kinase
VEIWSRVHHFLSLDDIHQLQELARALPYMADISKADVFIDCPLSENASAVLVVAEAKPTTARSLYRSSVIGQLAFEEYEPGVIHCIRTGQPVMGSRGTSQEYVAVEQNVTPIKNRVGQTIGALILEKDITENIKQEQRVEMLMERTEQLGFTLLQLALSEHQLPSLIHEGVILFDEQGIVSYVNPHAYQLWEKMDSKAPQLGAVLVDESVSSLMSEVLLSGDIRVKEIEMGPICLLLKAVSFLSGEEIIGGMLLLRDVSDMKEKERQLLVQSAVIKEIHHRVKNNLQTIASLLSLQARRSKSPELARAFSESINRIHSISLVHEILAKEGLEQMDCMEIIGKISNLMISMMVKPGQNIEVAVSGQPLYLSSEKATSLALIVNELIQNSMEHAFAGLNEGTILVTLKQEMGEAELVITDSGAGFDFTKAGEDPSHLGLQIVLALVNEGLQGQIQYSRLLVGSQTRIAFPYS